jgi:hypothetical protein
MLEMEEILKRSVPTREMLKATRPHYHGELEKFLNGEKVGKGFIKDLEKNKRLMRMMENYLRNDDLGELIAKAKV